MTQILPALQILREEILGIRDREGEIALPDDQLLLLMPNRQTPLSVRTDADTAFPRLLAVAALIDGDELLRHQQFDSAAPRFLEALDLIARHGLIHVLKQNAKPVRQFLSECRKRRRFVEKARHYRDTLMADLAVPNARSNQPSELTAAEYGVLRRLPLATSNNGLALELEVTEATVKFHLKKIYKKLGVHSRPEAIRAAAEKGWIDPLS